MKWDKSKGWFQLYIKGKGVLVTTLSSFFYFLFIRISSPVLLEFFPLFCGLYVRVDVVCWTWNGTHTICLCASSWINSPVPSVIIFFLFCFYSLIFFYQYSLGYLLCFYLLYFRELHNRISNGMVCNACWCNSVPRLSHTIKRRMRKQKKIALSYSTYVYTVRVQIHTARGENIIFRIWN